MSSENLHAPRERLTRATLSHHHAIVSVMEEMDAIDWYRQRAEDTEDAALREILLHNMREEVEHACMILEWLRRNDPEWSKQMDAYLYTEAPITEIERIEEHGQAGEPARSPTGAHVPEPAPRGPRRSAGRFTVGSLKGHGD
jgi:ferritin-like protein